MIRVEDVRAAGTGREAGRVRLVTFDRPEARNAFDTAMYGDAAAAFGEAAADDSVRVVVMTGAGPAFTAGQDLGELAALARSRAGGVGDQAGSDQAGGDQAGSDQAGGNQAGGNLDGSDGPGHGFPALLDSICRFDKPLVAAVNGAAVGLGFTLLAHADLVYVAESARLRVPFVEYAVPPEAASSYLFPQRLGWQRAASVLFTGDWVSAAQAVEWGLALRACPDDELLPAALGEAARVARGSLTALRGIKRLMQAWQQPQVAAALRAEADGYAARLGRTTTIPATATTRKD